MGIPVDGGGKDNRDKDAVGSGGNFSFDFVFFVADAGDLGGRGGGERGERG